MQITVGDLRDYLASYDEEAVVKFATSSKYGNTTIADYSHIVRSTESVYGKEIVIHPYFENMRE